MILENLWGLLLLLSIPVLILIYIIKQEHKERRVSSTYLWHLSERFLKKRLPIKRLTSLIAFMLQLTLLALLAFSATRPAVALGQVSGHIVVIDASASMQTEQDGVTRFEAAVAEVKAIAESGLCSSMTVIIASDTPACPVMGGSVNEAVNALEDVSCSFGGCDLYGTMKLVREAYARMGSAKVTFYTDTTYEDVENVTVVDMRRDEKNVAITSLTHAGGEFEGTLVSFGEDREVTVGLYLDGTIVDTRTVACLDGETATVTFDHDTHAFKEATLRFELADALPLDNSYSVMGKQSETVSVLVTGTETLFFETGFAALGNCDVTVKEEYERSDDGAYDLYIFSGNVPKRDSFPRKGMTIGFAQSEDFSSHINIGGGLRPSRPVHGDGVLLGDVNVHHSSIYEYGLNITYGPLLTVDPLLEGMEDALTEVYVRNTLVCADLDDLHTLVNPSRFAWTSVLEPLERSNSVACRRILSSGHRQYLFLFPLSESNLPMTPAFIMLLENACKLASAPSIPQTRYAVGETVEITLRDQAKDPVMQAPDETKTELKVKAPTFIPSIPGIHTLTYDYNKQTREASFFVHIPVAEYETYSAQTLYLSKTYVPNTEGEMLSNTMLPLIAVILTALLLFEWGYHYRGKY